MYHLKLNKPYIKHRWDVTAILGHRIIIVILVLYRWFFRIIPNWFRCNSFRWMAFCYQILLWRLLQIDADISRPYIHCHRHIWHCFPVCLSLASRRTKDQYCRSYIDHEDRDLLRFAVFLREVFWQLRLGCLLRFLYSSTGLHSISTQIIKFWRQVYNKQKLYEIIWKIYPCILTKQYKVLAVHQTVVKSNISLVSFAECPPNDLCVSRIRWWLPFGNWAIADRCIGVSGRYWEYNYILKNEIKYQYYLQ